MREALEARGFQVIHTNFRGRGGEIDLIARRGPEIWLVEVKTRRTAVCVDVSIQQQRRLTRMAYRYLQSLREPFETVQFVVAFVSFVDGRPQIDWVEHAFDGAW